MPTFPLVAVTRSLATATEWSIAKDAAYSAASPMAVSALVQAVIDMQALVAGDQIEIRYYKSVNAGTVAQLTTPVVYLGPQTQHFTTPPLFLAPGWDITIKLTTPANRTISWEVLQDIGDTNLVTLAAAASTAVAAAVWGAISEGAETVLHQLRIIRARAAGKHTVQDGNGAYAWRDLADTKDRIAGTRTGSAVTSVGDGT